MWTLRPGLTSRPSAKTTPLRYLVRQLSASPSPLLLSTPPAAGLSRPGSGLGSRPPATADNETVCSRAGNGLVSLCPPRLSLLRLRCAPCSRPGHISHLRRCRAAASGGRATSGLLLRPSSMLPPRLRASPSRRAIPDALSAHTLDTHQPALQSTALIQRRSPRARLCPGRSR